MAIPNWLCMSIHTRNFVVRNWHFTFISKQPSVQKFTLGSCKQKTKQMKKPQKQRKGRKLKKEFPHTKSEQMSHTKKESCVRGKKCPKITQKVWIPTIYIVGWFQIAFQTFPRHSPNLFLYEWPFSRNSELIDDFAFCHRCTCFRMMTGKRHGRTIQIKMSFSGKCFSKFTQSFASIIWSQLNMKMSRFWKTSRRVCWGVATPEENCKTQSSGWMVFNEDGSANCHPHPDPLIKHWSPACSCTSTRQVNIIWLSKFLNSSMMEETELLQVSPRRALLWSNPEKKWCTSSCRCNRCRSAYQLQLVAWRFCLTVAFDNDTRDDNVVYLRLSLGQMSINLLVLLDKYRRPFTYRLIVVTLLFILRSCEVGAQCGVSRSSPCAPRQRLWILRGRCVCNIHLML